jgi:hypothetical protein
MVRQSKPKPSAKPKPKITKPKRKPDGASSAKPLSKAAVLDYIYKKFSSSNKNGENKNIYALMFQKALDTPEKDFPIFYANETFKAAITEQYNSLVSKTVNSTTAPIDIDFTGAKNEDVVTYFFIMWLDTVHDEYNKRDFGSWLQDANGFINKLTNGNGNSIYKMVNFTKLPPVVDKIVIKLRLKIDASKNFIPAPTQSGWEGILKNDISGIFSDKDTFKEINTQTVGPNFIKAPFHINKDQEGEYQAISELITRTKDGNKYNVKPSVNIANLLDPGKKMPGEGYFYDFNPYYSERIVTNLYDLQQYNFKFPFFSITARVAPKAPPVSSAAALKGVDFFEVILNGKDKSLIGASKADAKSEDSAVKKGLLKGTKKADREIGKFLGDFIQLLITSSRNKAVSNNNRARVFGSGDGMACVMCYFISKVFLKTTPRIAVDLGPTVRKTLRLYGLNNFIDTDSRAIVNVAEPSTISGNIPISPPRPANVNKYNKFLKSVLSADVSNKKLKARLEELVSKNAAANKAFNKLAESGDFIKKLSFVKALLRNDGTTQTKIMKILREYSNALPANSTGSNNTRTEVLPQNSVTEVLTQNTITEKLPSNISMTEVLNASAAQSKNNSFFTARSQFNLNNNTNNNGAVTSTPKRRRNNSSPMTPKRRR